MLELCTGEFVRGCVLAPTLFSTCMDWILGRMLEKSSCSASFGNVKISDLDFADDAVIFAEIHMGDLEALNEASEPLGLRLSMNSDRGFQWHLRCCYLVCTCLW